MLASDGQRWYDRRRPEPLWPSASVAVLVTIVMFAAALAAMRSIRVWRSRAEAPAANPIAVRLDAPALPAQSARRLPPPANPRAFPLAPEPSAAPSAEPSSTKSGIAAPAPRDTSRAAGAPAAPAIVPGVVAPPRSGGTTPMAVGGGAPVAPSGVTIGSRTANTARYRDSVIQQRMKLIPGMALLHPPTGRELAELQESQRAALMLQQRTTTSGNWRDVHVATGEGLNGTGAIGGVPAGGSISLPLFSSGPSAAQRRKNDSLNTEYWLRQRRLGDRILLVRDSARADSLRRDSLAKRRVVPDR